MGRVDNKICLVTGASSGIGLATAQALIREGGTVVLADVQEEAGRKAAGELGERASFSLLDVTDESAWEGVIAKTVSAHGGLDVLVNNAGVLLGGDITTTTLEDYRKVMAVNAEGPFLGSKHAVPAMADSGGGSIINVSSMAAYSGMPPLTAYAASKAACRSIAQTTAVYCIDAKNGVRSNSVHPSPIATPMTGLTAGQELPGMGRTGAPEDVAAMILFLASDEACHVNGAQLVVDGGVTAR